MGNTQSKQHAQITYERAGTFRLFDLPPEIRNQIYSYALPGPDNIHSRNLATLKFPPITRASQQLRQESLAFLFAECNFVLYVSTNYRTRRYDKTHGVYWSKANGLEPAWAKADRSKSGTLGYKKVAQTFMKTAGSSAIFRDITFKVFCPCHVQEVRYSEEAKDERQRMASLHLIVEGERLSCGEESGASHKLIHYAEPVRDALNDAIAVARQIAARERFRGFTINDLSKIARGFRYELR